MKVLIVDDQFNPHDGMRLRSNYDLADYFREKRYLISYGDRWRGKPAENEVLCFAPKSDVDIREAFLEIFCFSSYDADLVILDIYLLPGNGKKTEGLDLLNCIRERDVEVPVIVMSAFENVEKERYGDLAFTAGYNRANSFISKQSLAENPEQIFSHAKSAEEYDIDKVQQQLSNRINSETDGYDLMECENLGTISFFVQEDLNLLEAFNAACGRRLSRESEINILDYGCGTGRFEQLLFKHVAGNIRVKAIDMAGGMLRSARKRPEFQEVLRNKRLEFDRGYAEYFKDGSRYDFVIMGFGFPSYCDFRRTLSNLRKNVLRRGGKVFVTFYQYGSPYYAIWDKEIREVLDRVGKYEMAERKHDVERKETLKKAINEIKRTLPIATTICRERCKLFVLGDELEQFQAVPMGDDEFVRLAHSCGFRICGEMRQYVAVCCGMGNRYLESLMVDSPKRPATIFDKYKGRYEEYYMRTCKDKKRGIDLSLVEQDFRISQKGGLRGYYTSALLEMAPGA